MQWRAAVAGLYFGATHVCEKWRYLGAIVSCRDQEDPPSSDRWSQVALLDMAHATWQPAADA
eukprot:12899253-Prorocentrum_lima.AAC.1